MNTVWLDKSANVALLNNSTAEIKNVLFGGIPSKQITGKIDTEFLAVIQNLTCQNCSAEV